MPKIAYILASDPEQQIASTRISVVNMLPHLEQRGYSHCILHFPKIYDVMPFLSPSQIERKVIESESDIVYFQKVHGKSAIDTVKSLKNRGIKTVFGVCDIINEEMVDECDLTIAVSEYLRTHHPTNLSHKVKIVHDGIEMPNRFKTEYSPRTPGSLDCVILTSKCSGKEVIRELPENTNVYIIGPTKYKGSLRKGIIKNIRKLITTPSIETVRKAIKKLDNHQKHKTSQRQQVKDRLFIPWSIDTVYDIIPTFDVGLIPVDIDIHRNNGFDTIKSRSANRLTQMMSVGLPVIASPIPSYLEIIKQGENGFIAYSSEDWFKYIEFLKDPKRRQEIGQAARESVKEKFSQEKQAEKLVLLLDDLLNQ